MTNEEVMAKLDEIQQVMMKQNLEMWAIATTVGSIKLSLIEAKLVTEEQLTKHETELAEEIKAEMEKIIDADNKSKATAAKDNS